MSYILGIVKCVHNKRVHVTNMYMTLTYMILIVEQDKLLNFLNLLH